MEFIDTHCHLNDEQLQVPVADAIGNAAAAGVVQFIVPGTDLENSKQAVLLANTYDNVYAAVGIHPHDTVGVEFDPTPLRPLIDESRVVAVGEIGMDFHHHDENTRDRQQTAFVAQLEFAVEAGLPVIVHGRDAYADILDVIRAYPESLGVLHSFEADYATAKQVLDAGWLISFTALLTYPQYDWLREVARKLPLELLMIETDAPYLPPILKNMEPGAQSKGSRGRSNEPKYVVEVAKVLAELKGLSLEEVAELTTETARNFFRLSV